MKSVLALAVLGSLINQSWAVARRHSHGGGGHSEDEEACEYDTDHLDDYDLPLHIGAVFIQFGVSGIAVLFPFLIKRLNVSFESQKFRVTLDVLKFFGTGVIIATAFIHLLPSSYVSFGSPCLTGHWAAYGFGWVGVFAMIAAFCMHLIEFLSLCAIDSIIQKKSDSCQNLSELAELPGDDAEKKNEQKLSQVGPEKKHGHHDDHDHGSAGHVHGLLMLSTSLTLYILEFGIALHSILIGIALSNATEDFIPLLIALIFHQGFEGLALGARICQQKYGVGKSLFMGFLYSITTPFGIALGIGIRYSYDPNSERAILATGILESMASGILLYNSFIGLLGNEMLHDTDFRKTSRVHKMMCFACMYIGVIAMAIVGKWA